MANGKAKGSEFERLISKKLSLWWSNNQRDDLFWRTQSSGARFTIRERKGTDTYNQSGDICSTHPDSKDFSEKIYIECKCYKNIGIWSFFIKKGMLFDWWKKAYENAQREGKYTFLIVKENNRPTLLFSDISLSYFCDTICQFYIYRKDVNVCLFDLFIKTASVKEFSESYIHIKYD